MVLINVAQNQYDYSKFNIDFSINSDNGVTLATYATEERAMEVLQSIVASYQANKMFESTEASYQNQMADKFLESGTTPFKYEMPKE